MSRFTYSTATPIGQIVSEAINHLQEGHAKIKRASEAVTIMNEEQITSELSVPSSEQTDFISALNQIKDVLEADPLSKLLPNLDQG